MGVRAFIGLWLRQRKSISKIDALKRVFIGTSHSRRQMFEYSRTNRGFDLTSNIRIFGFERVKIPFTAGVLHPLPIPLDHFSEISMNFIVPMPKSWSFDTLFVVINRLTGYTKIKPTLQIATTKDIAELFHYTWYHQFGLPCAIVSDRDKLFLSKFWKELHHFLNIKIKLSTAYHTETDGSTESVNKTIIVSLCHYVNK